jgi:hypothetical protein
MDRDHTKDLEFTMTDMQQNPDLNDSRAWLKQYDQKLYESVLNIFGKDEPTFYDADTVRRMGLVGIDGFYFNVVQSGDPNLPFALPEKHSLGVMIVTGHASRVGGSIAGIIYKQALDAIPEGGRLNTILFYNNLRVDLQALVKLGDLNKHPSMGAQVIVGAKMSGFLKAVVTFVERFANRDDILRVDEGGFEDGLQKLEQYFKTYQLKT